MRIRWRLLRRSQHLGPRHAFLVLVVLVVLWVGANLYHGYRSDVSLGRQVGTLQAQSTSLASQVKAEKEELRSASSSQWQSELARAQGLVPSGEQTYAIESSQHAAGPEPVQQGTQLAGQAAAALAAAASALP